jgi:PEP-CTERM motif
MSIRRIVFAVAMLMSSAAPVRAGFVTYTETVTGSGSLGGTNFTNDLITVTGVGNTANIFNPVPTILAVPVQASVTVAGVGTADFTDSILMFVNPSMGGGFSDTTNGLDVLDIVSKTVASYDLTTSFGLVSGPSFLTSYGPLGTSLGSLSYSVNSDVTFVAVASAAVPEPSALVLSGIAASAGLGVCARRRNRKVCPR